jgi:hypothetical protein
MPPEQADAPHHGFSVAPNITAAELVAVAIADHAPAMRLSAV